jgi:hypothetical protein
MTELEDIRADWALRDQSLAAAVQVQTNLLRETLAEQRLERVRRHGGMRGLELVLYVAFVAAFGIFLARNFGQWKFFIPAAALQIWTIVDAVVKIREREALRAVNFGLPPMDVQRQLARLRLERARTVKWELLTGQIVWWIPLAIVTFKGLFGVDLYTVSAFMPKFMAINLGLGLAFIPAALLVGRFVGPLVADTHVSRGVIDAITGRDLAEARAIAKRIDSFQ